MIKYWKIQPLFSVWIRNPNEPAKLGWQAHENLLEKCQLSPAFVQTSSIVCTSFPIAILLLYN